MAQTKVETFKGSINSVADLINAWAEKQQARILSTSLCYDVHGGYGQVFVMVVYETASGPAA